MAPSLMLAPSKLRDYDAQMLLDLVLCGQVVLTLTQQLPYLAQLILEYGLVVVTALPHAVQV